MLRIHIICEGPTEEAFIKNLLQPVFYQQYNIVLKPAVLGKAGHKGGAIKFDRLFIDIRNRLLGDRTAYCTTFFDFYALPTHFPGKDIAIQRTAIHEKAAAINDGMRQKIEEKLGPHVIRRFIPYVQMHEFEGLLFSHPQKFAEGIYQAALAPQFQEIRDEFATPEEINDSPETAPSKRIKKLVREYKKPTYGSLAALNIGLQLIRQECLLFDAWLNQLESLAPLDENSNT